jgi:hypothetical protein
VKILHERHQRDKEAVARFGREAALAAAIRHPNVVEVHGLAQVRGRPALVMELVDGESLARRLARQGPLREEELLDLAHGVALGLAAAHAQGVIHRDLKPANILVAGDHPKIADFGMARAASVAGVDAAALTVLGTPAYMAPECLDPLAVDTRADLYALGCILHEMATGEPPFSAPTSFATIEAHRRAPVPAIPETYSIGLRELVARLLAKQPGDRPQSASTVARALESLRSGSALALARSADPRDAGRCAACGEAVLEGVRACLTCALPVVRLDHGPFSVFVVGPGKPTSKLPSWAREGLLRWLGANEALGLVPARLRREIPRLPFCLVIGVDEVGALGLARSLERLGLHAAVRRGGRFAHESVPYKLAVHGGRVLGLAAAFAAAPALVYPPLALVTFTALLLAFPAVAAVVTARHSAPAAALRPPEASAALSPGLEEALRAVERSVEWLGPRHRGALRAVTSRVVAVAHADRDPELHEELRGALSWALTAAVRLEQLDRDLASRPSAHADDATRGLLHERDTWSARLLQVTAELEGLAARHARARLALDAAAVAPQGRADDEALADLRASVEALEEIAGRTSASGSRERGA